MSADLADVQSPDQTKALTILLAEDSEITNDLLTLLLTRRGHVVKSVNDGEAALKALADDSFDVCLIDFHLPKMDGLEVVQKSREHNGGSKHPPRFIGMTADVEGLLAHPADCDSLDLVFSKPIVAAEVYAAIERAASMEAPSSDGEGGRIAGSIQPTDALAATLVRSTPGGRFYRAPGSGDLLPDRRRDERKVVSLDGTMLRTEDGHEHSCRVVELSLFGAAIETSLLLKIGDRVKIGTTNARVVRKGEGEYSVEFLHFA